MTKAIPRIAEFISGLNKGGYFNTYGETVIYDLVYRAVIEVNPQLSDEKITWVGQKTDIQRGLYLSRVIRGSLDLWLDLWAEAVDNSEDKAEVHYWLTKTKEAVEAFQANFGD